MLCIAFILVSISVSAASGFFPYDSEYNNITSSYQSIYATSVTCPYPVFSAYQWAGYYVTVYNETAGYQTVKSTNGAINPYELRVDSTITLGPGEPFWIHENFDSDNVLLIDNFTQLQFLANVTDSGAPSPYAQLNTTIDCLGYNFNPITNYNNATFDGMGYNITNFYTSSAGSDYRGMFGTAYNANIHNFSMTNMSIEGDAYVGCIGYGEGIDVSNIIIDGELIATNTAGPLGGLFMGASTVTECGADVTTTLDSTGYSLGGGLIGYIREASSVSECYAHGDLTATNGDRNGGLIGTVAEYSSVSNCYSTVNVTGDASTCGLIGKTDTGIYTNCYASGEITGNILTSGLMDLSGTGAVITSCYWDVNATGVSTSEAGTGKTTTKMYQESTFSGWDFTNTWQLEGYPILSFESLDYSLNPTIVDPVNGTVLDSNYPDLTEVNFVWSGHGGTDSSSYQLARDENYNTIVSSGTTTVNYKSLSLSADDYYFRVKYNFDDDTESGWVGSQFTINATAFDYGAGVQGVVYRTSGGSQYALNGAKVTVYNDTYSDDYITSSNGYYLFTGLASGESYILIASKDGYESTTINPFTADSTTIVKDLILEEENAPNYIFKHKVQFILTNFIYYYPYADVAVYEGDSATALYTGQTGSDGTVTFDLFEDVEYRITFINSTAGIYRTWEGTPKDEKVYVLVFPKSTVPEDREIDDVLFGCYGSEINLTSGYINVTYNDTSATTTLAELWINDTDQTNLYYLSSTNSVHEWSQMVNATNSTYVVNFKIQNTQLEEPLEITRTISFYQDVRLNLGLSNGWNYIFIAVCIIIFLAALFSRLNAYVGAVIVSLAGWFIFFVGWLTAGLTFSQTVTIGVMLLFGTLISIGTAIKSGEKNV